MWNKFKFKLNSQLTFHGIKLYYHYCRNITGTQTGTHMAYKQAIDFMRIRQYVIDLIATSEAQPQRIPSSRKLAPKFGVTHTTVQRVIRELVAEGYLVQCKNGGAMTCPQRVHLSNMKIIGVILGEGKNAFETYYHHRVCCELFQYLTHQSATICTQNLFLNTPGELMNSVEHNHLSALIAIGVIGQQLKEQIQQLKNQSFPVVSFINRIDEISSYYFRYFDICKLVLDQMIKEGRRRIIIVADSSIPGLEDITESVAEFRRKCRTSDHQIMVLSDSTEESINSIKTLLDFGSTFDAVVAFRQFHKIYELVKKHLDIEKQCRMVNVEWSVHTDMNYSGYLITYDLASAIKPMVKDLFQQIKKQNQPLNDYLIPISLRLYSNGAYLNEVKL